MSMASSDQSIHVLLLPFPVQGHINPLLQFGKRLAGRNGVRCTLAATRFVVNSTKPTPSSVHVAVFSDGCDNGGPDELGGIGGPYFERLECAGSETLDELLRSESERGRPVHVVVYDAFLPWAQGVARRRGAACAAFLTQTCAVDALYAHAWAGRIPPPPLRPGEFPELAGLPSKLELTDMPTFLADTNYPPCFRELLVNQFLGLDTVDHVLINSFYDLEPQEADYLASTWGAKTVGPTVPSAYLDNRLPDDVSYGVHLHTPMAAESKAWLDTHPTGSVLYVSFGSMASLGSEQMAEIAEGLYSSGKPFLWVVRAKETAKLPKNFADKAKSRGLIVPWCPQLEVLAHPSIGCFMTHCGWNSTVEALSAGVPMVAMPNWSDQTTNAKYIQDVWCVGVRVQPDAKGVVRSEEVERRVREVMEGEMRKEFRKKALDWSNRARKAMSEGGSSDINISDFLSSFGNPE
ncbi:UDP-glucosyltransferase UGT13248-like [Phragmites australis]|uniref:UDP-glucosyltransferase UGT13248-like n=1 Tax=Phragmites australis TaxID=29695 RepID=UPI002D79E7A9|nr:UDP-glucosyltransferase UGT13248-like [Phragmites australis]